MFNLMHKLSESINYYESFREMEETQLRQMEFFKYMASIAIIAIILIIERYLCKKKTSISIISDSDERAQETTTNNKKSKAQKID